MQKPTQDSQALLKLITVRCPFNI